MTNALSRFFNRSLIVATAAVALSACVSETVPVAEQPLPAQSTVIAVTSPDIELGAGHQLSWFEQDFLVVEGREPSDQNLASYRYIKQRIQTSLEAKGFVFAPAGTQTDRQVVVAALLGEGSTAKDMERLFKLYPNLSVDDGDFKLGTLLVAVIDPVQHKAAWRGAIQALVDESVSDEERQLRIDMAVKRLLRSLEV